MQHVDSVVHLRNKDLLSKHTNCVQAGTMFLRAWCSPILSPCPPRGTGQSCRTCRSLRRRKRNCRRPSRQDCCLLFWHNYLLTLNVLYHTIPHKLWRWVVTDVHGLQSFVSTHSEESECAFHPLFAVTNAFNVCIFEGEFSHFFRRAGLGV